MQIRIINQLVREEDAISMDRSSLFGDGFFTTGVIQCNQLIFMSEHLERLELSAKRLLFPPLDLKTISTTINQLCQKHRSAIIRINVFREQIQRGYSISNDATTQVTMMLSPFKEKGYEYCELFDAKTEISSNQSLAGIKHLNRLDSVLAASEVKKTNHEALMYQQKNLICGSKSNVFVLLNDQWMTPTLKKCGVDGIMRQQVLYNMQKQNIHCEIGDIHLEQTKHISAAIITNCVFGAWTASHLNGRDLDLNASNQMLKSFKQK